MARKKSIVLASLNIAVSPHPPGTYPKFLRTIENIEVPAFGDERAMVVNVRKRTAIADREILSGHIFFYTELQLGGAWFDTIAKKPVDADIIGDIEIPENLRPNLKSSRFVFDVRTHRMYFERKNFAGDVFGPKKVKKVLENLTGTDRVMMEFPNVSITLIPRHDSISRVLSVPNLKRVVIRVERPNADDISTETARLMQMLEGMKAKKLESTLVKAAGAQRLDLNDDFITMAKVSSENGYTHAFGETNAGMKVERKTSNYPAMHHIEMDEGDDAFGRIFEFLRYEFNE